MRYNSILDAVGNTPLVKIAKVNKNLKATIWAKMEFMNPGGSIKDRIARHMVERAEAKGLLKPGDTIIENSSGNTAMGLAIVAIQKGYKCKMVIRDTTSPAKINMLHHLGVETVLVDASLPPEDEKSYNNYAKLLAETTPNSLYIDQHNNLDNNEAHYKTTGPEIWESLDGKVDYMVAGIGTGGTLFGAGRFLKEKNPDIKLIGIDPEGSIFYDYFKNKKLIKPWNYKLEGLGDEFILKTVQFDLLDDMIKISDKTAFDWTYKLAETEGIIAGGSSGANIYGAIEVAKMVDRPCNIVTVFPDSGYKYLTTIYNKEWMDENGC
jgi:cystathionine beta-synthase